MWNDLSMAQKSELMKMFIQNGVYDLNTIIKEYDSRHQSGDEATLPNYSQNVFAEGGNIDDDRDDIDNRTGKPRYRRDIHNVNITSSSENDIEGAARDTSTIGPLAFYPPKYYIGKQGNQFEENPNVTYDSWFDEHPEMIDVMTDIVGRYNNRLNNRGQQLPQLNRFYFEKLYNPEDDPIIHEAIERMLQAKWNRDVRTYNDNRTLNLWDTVEKFPAANTNYAKGGHLYQGYSEPTQKMRTLYDEASDQIYGVLPELTVSTKAPKGYTGYPKAFEKEYSDNGGIYGGFRNKDRAYKEWEKTQKYFSPENLDKYRGKGFKPFAPLVAASMAAPAATLGAAYAYPAVSAFMSNPIVEGVFTADALSHAPDHIKSGIEDINNGNIWGGVSNLGFTALDLVGAGELGTRLLRPLSKGYRAKHAYNTITPVGYGANNPAHKKELKNFIHDLWHNTYSGRNSEEAYKPLIETFGKLGEDAREEAFRLYLGLEKNPKIFVKTGPDSYRYNLSYIKDNYDTPYFNGKAIIQTPRSVREYGSFNTDFLGGVGASTSQYPTFQRKINGVDVDFEFVPRNTTDYSHFAGIDYNGRRIAEPLPLNEYDYIMHDKWDVYPLSRKADNISTKVESKINNIRQKTRDKAQDFRRYMYDKGYWNIYNQTSLDKALNRFRTSPVNDLNILNNKLVKKIDSIFGNIEAGPYLGGKPFDVQTHIPMYNKIDNNGQEVFFIDTNKFAQGGNLGHITPYGQWQYPHQITTIPSNNITMQGVNYPVVGVSDTGDTKVMLPGLDYLYDGNYVTEYPV